MKRKSIIIEFLFLSLVFYFFCEGIYKIAYWTNYSNWVHNAPLLARLWVPLTYVVPIGEIALSIALLTPAARNRSLYWIIALSLAHIIWMGSIHVYSGKLFWPFPYYGLWNQPTWMQKALISLGLCWVSIIVIILSSREPLFRRNFFSLSSND